MPGDGPRVESTVTLAKGTPSPGGLAAGMERFSAEVKEAIPPERLLVWAPADGWEPLCAFLGVDVPPAPLPRLNDTESFKERVVAMSLAKLNEWHARGGEAERGAVATPVTA